MRGASGHKTPDPKLGEKLPSLGTTELIPEEPANEDYGQGDRVDIQHRREQERDVRGATKTIAQLALEMSHVHRLAGLIKEKADLLKELAMKRKSYQDEVKESHMSTYLRTFLPVGTWDLHGQI